MRHAMLKSCFDSIDRYSELTKKYMEDPDLAGLMARLAVMWAHTAIRYVEREIQEV